MCAHTYAQSHLMRFYSKKAQKQKPTILCERYGQDMIDQVLKNCIHRPNPACCLFLQNFIKLPFQHMVGGHLPSCSCTVQHTCSSGDIYHFHSCVIGQNLITRYYTRAIRIRKWKKLLSLLFGVYSLIRKKWGKRQSAKIQVPSRGAKAEYEQKLWQEWHSIPPKWRYGVGGTEKEGVL